MQRPDLRHISGNIREALEGCDREALLDILTFVFKEYLVEGPPPLLVHQTERVEELEGLSFAALIATLQTRLDLPELGLFQVEGDQVSVRAGGVLTPLTAGGGQGQGQVTATAGQYAPPQARAQQQASSQQAQRPSSPQAPPQPGVRVVETDIVRRPPPRSGAGESVQRGRHDLAGMAHDIVNDAIRAEDSAPAPHRGMSIRGRTSGGAMMPMPSSGGSSASSSGGRGAGPAQAQPPQGRAPEPTPEPPADDDSASTRFSLLELD